MNRLITLAKEFNESPGQAQAIRWLQNSTGVMRQQQFATMWRDGQDTGKAIDFVNVFHVWADLPHQNAALRWLEQGTGKSVLEEFARLWTLNRKTTAGIKLGVPWFPQTDNKHEPHRTCNTSACAMVAKFLGAKIDGDDHYYQFVRKYGDTTDHAAQTRALNEVGIKSTWRTDLDFKDLDTSLELGLPIVIGILHRGTLRNPTGGHMVVVVGRSGAGDYIVHDPYGSLLDNYSGAVTNGKGAVYSRAILNHRWLVEGARSGWGRLFHGNR